MTGARLDVYSKAGVRKAKVSAVVTLPLGQFAVAGKIYTTKAEAEAAAVRLVTD